MIGFYDYRFFFFPPDGRDDGEEAVQSVLDGLLDLSSLCTTQKNCPPRLLSFSSVCSSFLSTYYSVRGLI